MGVRGKTRFWVGQDFDGVLGALKQGSRFQHVERNIRPTTQPTFWSTKPYLFGPFGYLFGCQSQVLQSSSNAHPTSPISSSPHRREKPPADRAMTKRKLEDAVSSSVEAHLVSSSPYQAQYEPEDARMMLVGKK